MPKILTVREVAERLAVSEDHVRALITSGRIRAIDVSAGKRPWYRIEEPELDAFIEAKRTNTLPTPFRKPPRARRPRLQIKEFF
jgi:excisionase family DNA binding protein